MIKPVETRTERYQRYRQQILSMPDEAFEPDGSFAGSPLSRSDMESIPPLSTASESIALPPQNPSDPAPVKKGAPIKKKGKTMTPYTYYLSQRKAHAAIKWGIAALAIVGLIIFYVIFVGGPNS